MVKNLTEGKPLPLLFFFALPMVAGNLFQQLYNMVDTAVVGKFVGEDAVAAVGSSFPIVFLSVAVASGLSMGCNVVVSQLFGAGRIHEMKSTISTAIISLSVLGLIIMGLGTIFAGPLLQLLGTDPDIMADSELYLQIYFGGAVFLFLYNTLNGIYNAQGDSKTPLIFLIISSLTNIVLDLLFVIKFDMRVAGVAWATLIAQGMCAVASLVVMYRRMKRLPCEESRRDEKVPLFHMTAVRRIAQIGLPSMLQQSLVSLSMMMMQGLVNSYGKVLVAGYTAATKIDTLAMLPNMNFSNAMSSYTACCPCSWTPETPPVPWATAWPTCTPSPCSTSSWACSLCPTACCGARATWGPSPSAPWPTCSPVWPSPTAWPTSPPWGPTPSGGPSPRAGLSAPPSPCCG